MPSKEEPSRSILKAVHESFSISAALELGLIACNQGRRRIGRGIPDDTWCQGSTRTRSIADPELLDETGGGADGFELKGEGSRVVIGVGRCASNGEEPGLVCLDGAGYRGSATS